MTILDEYLSYYDTYMDKYGENIAVLFQCGMFYEIYGVENEMVQLGNVTKIAEILNIIVTRRDKKIKEVTHKNHLMSGFPLHSIDRFIQVLLNENYTIIVVSQVTPPPNPKRELTGIYSPGVRIVEDHNTSFNYLVCMCFDVSRVSSTSKSKNIRHSDSNSSSNINLMVHIGMCAIDISTNFNIIHEASSWESDRGFAIDEAFRFIQSYRPSEILLISSSGDKELPMKEELISQLGISQCLIHIIVGESDEKRKNIRKMCKLDIQNSILGKIFTDHGVLTPIEFLGLERHQLATIAYVNGIQFITDHNPDLTIRLSTPIVWNDNIHLLLAHNTINQLNLIKTSNEGCSGDDLSLLGLTNKTKTAMGSRLLREFLLNPSTDPIVISERLNIIEILRTDDMYKEIEKRLQGIRDIAKIYRKIEVSKLHPSEFATLHDQFLRILELIRYVSKNSPEILNKISYSTIVNDVEMMIKPYLRIIDIDECAKYALSGIQSSLFKSGIYPVIDELTEKIDEYTRAFDLIEETLQSYVGRRVKDNGIILKRLDGRIELTKTRFKELKKDFEQFSVRLGNKRNVMTWNKFIVDDKTKSKTKLSSSLLSQMSLTLASHTEEIGEVSRKQYVEFLAKFSKDNVCIFQELIKLVSLLDFYQSSARVSLEYGYCKPTIIHSKNSKKNKHSYLSVRGVRHPIVERINTIERYVAHDIELGTRGCDGILLGGINGVGKTVIMKAIGLTVIMAQAGMYVPARSLTIKPFRKILTRIIGNDNIYRGQSSFAVEMSELRGILDRQDSDSLILGDEICHGTESLSATALVAASIIAMSRKKSKFIFATHLHELSDIMDVRKLPNVKLKHLKVTFDRKNDKLVYDRTLQKGFGNTVYGIEVAEYMKLPNDMIKCAYSIRKMLDSDNSNGLRNSRYNEKLIVDKCGVCGEEATQTHHIIQQKDADDHGIIDDVTKKNDLHNLVPLCDKCHDMIHHPSDKKLVIHGFKQTSKGCELKYDISSFFKLKRHKSHK